MDRSLPSKLYYHGTTTEVLLGDRVALKGMMSWKGKVGTVSCIPDRTGRQRAAEGKEPDDWLISFDDGTMTGWLYSPEDLQPPKRLSFLSRDRAAYKGITNAQVDEMEKREEEHASWQQLALVALFKLALFVGVVSLLVYTWRNYL